MQENRFGLFDAAINTSEQLCKTTYSKITQAARQM